MIFLQTLIFYISIELVSLFFMYFAEKSSKKQSNINKGIISKCKIFMLLSAIQLIVLIGFRGIDVGTDTYNVAATLKRVVTDTMLPNDIHWLGVPYVCFLKLIGFFITDNYVLLNLILGSITIIFLYKSIWDNSENKTLSLFIFLSTCLLYQMMNQSRQQLAIMVIFYAYKFIKNRNFTKYLFFVLLAFCFHKSAIIMLPFYFIANSKIDKKNICIYFIIGALILLMGEHVEQLLLMTDYGATYINSGMYDDSSKAIYNLIVRVCLLLFPFLINKESIKKYSILYNLCIWCVITQFITYRVYAFGRITTYFFVFFILLIPNAISNIENKNYKKLITIITILLFIIYHIVYYIFTGQLSKEYHFFA